MWLKKKSILLPSNSKWVKGFVLQKQNGTKMNSPKKKNGTRRKCHLPSKKNFLFFRKEIYIQKIIHTSCREKAMCCPVGVLKAQSYLPSSVCSGERRAAGRRKRGSAIKSAWYRGMDARMHDASSFRSCLCTPRANEIMLT